MAATLRRLAEPDLNLVVYSGAVSREDLLAFWR
jgi:hypothetical protein